MGAIYRYLQKYDLIPRREECNPIRWVSGSDSSDWKAKALTPEETLLVLEQLRQPEYELLLLVAATGLRQSEALALKWRDLDEKAGVIRIQNAYVLGALQDKTKASRATVPYQKLLADDFIGWRKETLYADNDDFVFASEKCDGIPRTGSMIVADYIRPAAIRAGVIDGKAFRLSQLPTLVGDVPRPQWE